MRQSRWSCFFVIAVLLVGISSSCKNSDVPDAPPVSSVQSVDIRSRCTSLEREILRLNQEIVKLGGTPGASAGTLPDDEAAPQAGGAGLMLADDSKPTPSGTVEENAKLLVNYTRQLDERRQELANCREQAQLSNTCKFLGSTIVTLGGYCRCFIDTADLKESGVRWDKGPNCFDSCAEFFKRGFKEERNENCETLTKIINNTSTNTGANKASDQCACGTYGNACLVWKYDASAKKNVTLAWNSKDACDQNLCTLLAQNNQKDLNKYNAKFDIRKECGGKATCYSDGTKNTISCVYNGPQR